MARRTRYEHHKACMRQSTQKRWQSEAALGNTRDVTTASTKNAVSYTHLTLPTKRIV